MADDSFRLTACREFLDRHPDAPRIREQIEALEAALPDSPGVAVSFCRVIIESTCKTIYRDRLGHDAESGWDAPKLIKEVLRVLHLGRDADGAPDAKLKAAAEHLVRGINSLTTGIVELRNHFGAAAHGADAYAPMLDANYAEIMARSTDAVVGLLLRTHKADDGATPSNRFPYGAHADFDDWVDDDWLPPETGEGLSVLGVPLRPSEALFRTDFNAYRDGLVNFREDKEPE